MPRARIKGEDGRTNEWKSKSLRVYQRRTKQAEALIAGACLSETNTSRMRRALLAVFECAAGKDVVSRTWRKVKGDWDAWNARSPKDEPIVWPSFQDELAASERVDYSRWYRAHASDSIKANSHWTSLY